ncbi:hypothetical protein QJ857_gp0232 [Tupanvirus soda lake]|uniref:NlpC/P60 domain-containing protein n=2 Tax=Tupanvirus TaxID=2094720 RepID=A0A6N1NXC5_9VIRU|nr:hypothetical protein QJ857_gp0232 [Tupanvirus soda lake]QKU35793.1 hypothetical protein [Tupanvirus soda lake]
MNTNFSTENSHMEPPNAIYAHSTVSTEPPNAIYAHSTVSTEPPNAIYAHSTVSMEPPHVYWARLMLSAIINGNGITTYRHTNGPVYWGPHDNQPKYVSITDCSGFVNALLRKAYNLPIGWDHVNRAYASTYYRMINEQKYFYKITNINQALVGDFIVFKILPGTSKSDNTGHIMLINAKPIQIQPTNPFIKDTIQWAVNIIDQSSAHGTNDTRYHKKITGLGSGYLRMYTDFQGNLQGYSWSTDPKSIYIDKSVHPLVIGRFKLLI